MKRSILFSVFFIFTFTLFSQVPDYEFIVEPTELMFTNWDYMPGSYNSIPVRIQPEISFPNGYLAGGVYIVYQAKEPGPTSNRKVYYSYLDSEGNLVSTDLISSNDIWQGYPGVDIDPISCDPIASWHAMVEPDNSYDCLLSTDVFHILGSCGNWTAEFIAIDNPESGQPTTGFIDDEFIWPAVFISRSLPLGGEYRRVYVTGNNYTPSHGEIGFPCENVILGYADFLSSDLIDLSALDWSYRTIEQMDAWSAENPYRKPFKGCAVYENIVVYAGYLTDEENTICDAFVLVNENYGEGDFEYYAESYYFPQWNPFTTPVELRHEIMFSNHMNVIIKENGLKTTWTGAMGITYDGNFNSEACMLYPKEFVFDMNTHEFSFKDLYIEGANPDDNIPMCPWDLDEDGIVDSFSVTGDPLWVKNWPIYYPEGLDAYQQNYFKTVENENWMVSVWSDGTKAKRFYDGNNAFAAWEATPEIAIIISADNGQTWSQPILLNANETPELADQIPCYIYPGDVIEIISNTPGNYRGKVHLFYLDDFVFGSQLTGTMNFGGNLMYTALDIEFPAEWNPGTSTENEEVPQPQITMYNYPNPFNPTTTISFSLNTENTENTELVIYNLKGQKVKTFLINSSTHTHINSIVWDGNDENGKSISSGVYLYKLSINDKIVSAKKCLLLK